MRAIALAGAALFAFLFVTGRRADDAGAPRPASWLLARAAGAAALLLSLVAAMNYLVNPLGIYSPRFFEPIALHSRSEKMRLYRVVDRPDILILGSSSSFTMSPAYVRERTGRLAFNASVHGGVPEDFLAFLRYAASIDKLPKLIIVPLSVELVRPDLPSAFEPHNPLRPYVETGSRDILLGARWLLTVEQTEASLRLLAAERAGRPPSHYRFDPDGMGHFVSSDVPLETLVDLYMATKEWGRGLFAFRELDRPQMQFFHDFLSLARGLGIRVVVYVPPLHPRATAFYERETNLPALRAQLASKLEAWRAQGLIGAVYDFTRVQSYGGDASEFHDLAHPTADASRRMLDVVLSPLRRG